MTSLGDNLFEFEVEVHTDFNYFYHFQYGNEIILDFNAPLESNPRSSMLNNFIGSFDGIHYDYRLHCK